MCIMLHYEDTFLGLHRIALCKHTVRFIFGEKSKFPTVNILGNIGDLFVKCMRQDTKSHLYHLLRVSDYNVMYRHRAQSVL